jgi:hypothetical protein
VFAGRDVVWRRRFGEPQETSVVTLVAEDRGAMVGFAHSVPTVRYVWPRLDVLSCRLPA